MAEEQKNESSDPIVDLALMFHHDTDGHQNCVGVECPAVQRIIVILRKVADLRDAESARLRRLLGC